MITRSITRPLTSPIARAVTANFGNAWNPRALFAAGEQGVIYDPSDLSTLWQDSAGTTPVTAAGQPVGLMLDKRLGLVRGAELAPNSGNVVTFSSATQNSSVDVTPAAVLPSTGFVEVTFTVTGYTAGSARVIVYGAGANAVAAATGASANGTYTYRVPFVAGGSASQVIRVQTYSVAPNTLTVTVISVRELPGNHAFQPTAASRPMLRQNATTGAYYLETDGSDDWMQTNAIDFTGTDKVSVFTGVRKLSDAAIGTIAEHGVGGTDARAMSLSAPRGAGVTTFGFDIRDGVAIAATAQVTGYAAPVSAVLTAVGDYSGAAESRLRVNGGTYATATTGVAGNCGNYPLYLFRRAGTSLPFNGHFYGLVIVGRLTTDAETRNMDRLYSIRTGAILA